MDFVQDNPGEPVTEETFTHSHLSWSSIVPYLLHPFNLKNDKLLYLSNNLNNFDEILHADADGLSSVLAVHPVVPFAIFKNPRWRTATILKIEKNVMSPKLVGQLNMVTSFCVESTDKILIFAVL